MRKLMENFGMLPPTFESNREDNRFTVRLLLHHLLNEEDLEWLKLFDTFRLNDNQKRILIFIREVRAIDNSAARQINGTKSIISNKDLRKLKELKLLEQRGKNKFTYYVPSQSLISLINNEKYLSAQPTNLSAQPTDLSAQPTNLSAQPTDLSAQPTNLSAQPTDLSAQPTDLSAQPTDLSAQPTNLSAQPTDLSAQPIPKDLQEKINNLGHRANDKNEISNIILEICSIRDFKKRELAELLGRTEKYIARNFIKPLLEDNLLKYKYPEMINHPEQAYSTKK
jgi:ATP-dependent DNA helicase RecG